MREREGEKDGWERKGKVLSRRKKGINKSIINVTSTYIINLKYILIIINL